MRNIIPKDNYLVYEDTGDKVVFYECDPSKNTECEKLMCRGTCGIDAEDEGSIGFCAKTDRPEYAKDGGKKWHAVLKPSADGGEPYWGRECITE